MQDVSENKSKIQGFIHTTARIAIASFFIGKAAGFVVDPNGMGFFLMQQMVPAYLVWPNVAFEFIAAFSIMVGLQTRLASALLAIYLFWSSFLLNYATGDATSYNMFWQDIALIGGLLLLFANGRGDYALDNYFDRKQEEPEAEPVEGEVLEYAKFEPYPAQ